MEKFSQSPIAISDGGRFGYKHIVSRKFSVYSGINCRGIYGALIRPKEKKGVGDKIQHNDRTPSKVLVAIDRTILTKIEVSVWSLSHKEQEFWI